MKAWILIFLVFITFSSKLKAQFTENPYYDSLLYGTWVLADPEKVALIKQSNEPFLQEELTFKDRHILIGFRRSRNLLWYINEAGTTIKIVELEAEDSIIRYYPVMMLTENELVLKAGKHEIKYKKKQ